MKGLTVGGRFIIMGVPERLDAKARRVIRDIQPGGFILFGRNIGLPKIPDAQGRVGTPGSPQKLRALIDELRSLVDHEPVVCIDQEGGRVSRLRGLRGGAESPPARALSGAGRPELIATHGKLTGRLLRLFGVNLDLCPVLDVEFEGNVDNSLGDRCWGLTPESVARGAGAFNRALRGTGVLSCGKHFPGYSLAALDPHYDLPVIAASRRRLELDWLPYRRLSKSLDFVMTAHASYPALDRSGRPASLSRRIIGLLRGELGFKGWIISDDLDMGAITRHTPLEDAVRLAVRAGTDQILLCHDLERVAIAARAIAELPAAAMRLGLKRLDALQKRLKPPSSFSTTEFKRINAGLRDLRRRTLGPGASPFTAGAGKIGPIEAARLSPVNVVGDRSSGQPREYGRRAPRTE
jgi:beta-N-acetylhexosaminidase